MGSTYTALYTVSAGKDYGTVDVKLSWKSLKDVTGFNPNYTAFCALPAPKQDILFALCAAAKTIDTYHLSNDGSALQPVRKATVEREYDLIRSLNVGGVAHLFAYEASSGAMDFYRVGEDLSLTLVYHYAATYGNITTGYTTLEPYAYNGEMLLLAYDRNSGRVATYQLGVTADAPLTLAQVWSGSWAQGWTRFSLFALGGENFFLKSNTKYETVYIDHLADNAADGSHPVGRRLPLPLDLTLNQTFQLDGTMHLFTYKADDGSGTIERIRCDCQGWSQAAAFAVVPAAGHAVVLGNDDATCLFVY